MFRNQYDSDVTVWSPQGRLHQVEYAMEAVKLGSATIGLKNKEYAVLIALKRAVSELSAYQKKIIPIDDHIGISISGLTADARMLSRFMRTECLNHRYSHDAPMPVGRLIALVGNKMQICTQRYDKRPLGVGLLVAGYDDQGPHIYQTCPSANFFDCRAMAIGARSQSARTYLEKHLTTFIDCDLQDLVAHGLRGLRDTLPNEVDLNNKNVSIAIVGPKTPLRICDEEELSRFLALVEGEERRGGASATGDAGAAPPEQEGEERDPQVATPHLATMRCVSAYFLLIIALAESQNLEYLDPKKLQTVVPAATQQETATNIIYKYTRQVVVTINPRYFNDNKDAFRLRTNQGQLHIEASTGVAALWGFNHYLKKYCKSQIAWQVQRVVIPNPLPEVDEFVVANDRFRYYQNVCTASYSFVWWKPDDWLKHVEWMALNGINLVLAPVAQEAAWMRVYRKLGLTDNEIDQHFTGPAFLSWLRMGNVRSWAGPLPQTWHDIQRRNQDAVVDYMYKLGMVPVMPAFNGHVPKAFTRVFPNKTFYNVGTWNKFNSDYSGGLFMDPTDDLFKNVGKMFLEEVTDHSVLASHIYTADPFNEVKTQFWSTSFAVDTAKAIYRTLVEFDNNAVWLLQNWMFVSDPVWWPISRVQSFLRSVPSGRMLILDLQSEQWPQYDLYDMYFGQPFIWCMLHNFGGTLGMFGNMVTINKDVYEVRARANSTMIGIGLTPEGINQNYVVYDLMLESAWRKGPVEDLETWAGEYAERRYGCNGTTDAWRYLLRSVYSFNSLHRVRGKYVVTRRPSFKITPWAWYTSHDLFEALRILVINSGPECYSLGFYYDVVDVTRQALQYRAEQLYVNLQLARSSNTWVFNASISQFLDVMTDMQSILYTNQFFMASDWINRANSFSKDVRESYLYELNSRNQITLWGPNGEISDYACKQWAELFRYYYIPRWSSFLYAYLDAKLKGEIFDERSVQNIVRSTVEVGFLDTTFEPYNPQENPVDLGLRFYYKWANVPGLADLPQAFIKPMSRRTTMADFGSDEVDEEHSVVMLLSTTPTS